MLGLDAALQNGRGHAYATLDYLHRLDGGDDWEALAFARGYGGIQDVGHGLKPVLGAVGGFEVRF